MFTNSNQDIPCSLTTSYEEMLLSTEPFQQPMPLAVSSFRCFPFLFKTLGLIMWKKNDGMVGYAYAGDGGFFSGLLARGGSL